MLHIQGDRDYKSPKLAFRDGLDSDGLLGEEELDDNPLVDEHVGDGEAGGLSLEQFGKEVLNRMLSDNVAPIPSNFSLYFDRLLEEKPDDFRKSVMQLLELEDANNDERKVNFEKKLKDSFLNIKQILQLVATLYKNLTLMKDVSKKRGNEAKNAANSLAFQNIVNAFENDLARLSSILDNQNTNIKKLYQSTATIVNEVETQTIYDSKYGVYNKRYLIAQLDKELKMMQQFGHQSTLVTAKLTDALLRKIKSDKAKQLITKTISRLILKTSRRSDVVSHYGEGVFAIVLKYSDLASAKRASERLHDLVTSTNFFFGEKEISLDVNIGIAKIEIGKDKNDILKNALEALEKSEDSSEPFVCYNEDLRYNDKSDF